MLFDPELHITGHCRFLQHEIDPLAQLLGPVQQVVRRFHAADRDEFLAVGAEQEFQRFDSLRPGLLRPDRGAGDQVVGLEVDHECAVILAAPVAERLTVAVGTAPPVEQHPARSVRAAAGFQQFGGSGREFAVGDPRQRRAGRDPFHAGIECVSGRIVREQKIVSSGNGCGQQHRGDTTINVRHEDSPYLTVVTESRITSSVPSVSSGSTVRCPFRNSSR